MAHATRQAPRPRCTARALPSASLPSPALPSPALPSAASLPAALLCAALALLPAPPVVAQSAPTDPATTPLPTAGSPRPAWARAFVEVALHGVVRAGLVELVAAGFDVIDVRGDEVRLSLPEARLHELRALGHEPQVLPHPLDVDPTLAADYHDHAALSARLALVAANHPDLCRLVSIGTSVQGRELWFLKISDDPDLEQDEPEFRWVSSIRGDEVVGMELLVRLIDLLTDGYGSDPLATALVDGLEIWVMPLLNPDGLEAGSRYNAHGVDLNRDFPDRVTDPLNTLAGRQVETQRMMAFGFTHTPVLSANLHGGSLVVNDPYDSDPDPWASYSATPDDALVLARTAGLSRRASRSGGTRYRGKVREARGTAEGGLRWRLNASTDGG